MCWTVWQRRIDVDARPGDLTTLREVKDKELDGYSYDGVGASFELWPCASLSVCRAILT